MFKAPKEKEDILNQASTSYNSIIHQKRYRIVKKFASGKVLDVGCGLGYGSKIIKGAADQIVGIDIDQKSIDYARENYGDVADFLVYSGEKIPFPNEYFNVVCCLEVIEHIDRAYHMSFVSEMKRVLKRDGILVISTPNRNFFVKRIMKTFGWRNPYHKYEYSLSEFEKSLLGDRHITLLKKYYLGSFLQFSNNPLTNFIYRLLPFVERHRAKIIDIDLRAGFILPLFCNDMVYVLKKGFK